MNTFIAIFITVFVCVFFPLLAQKIKERREQRKQEEEQEKLDSMHPIEQEEYLRERARLNARREFRHGNY